MLVVIGKKDVQADWKLDGEALVDAAQGGANVSFLYPDDANHVLLHGPRAREELTGADDLTRNSSEAHLDKETVEAILKWLCERAM